jgi:L-aminopeptidase/D-esterase-like protein
VVFALVGVGAVMAAREHGGAPSQAKTMMSNPGASITAVAGITVGHYTMAERPTGCTVVLADGGAVGAVAVRGGAPGTRETDLLAPVATVQHVHAIVLAGGSAFGLDAAGGVMRYLGERKVGFATSAGVVPIVPAAVIFDLAVGGRPDIRPDAACGYEAARRAAAGAVEEGSVGAGAGATVGKLLGVERAMKGGVGTAALSLPDGLVVGALMVVNAVGTVIDPRTARAVAGVRTGDGRALEDPFDLIRRGAATPGIGREHTTIGVVSTNARLTRAEALAAAEMAHTGIARAIVPSHTPSDGDTLFVLATGRLGREANVGALGALAAEVVVDAILRGVRAARGLPGYPAVADLR